MLLEANDLSVRYRNGALGLINASIAASAGQVVTIFGPNGAGKTTAVRAISGFLKTEGAKVARGSVRMFGKTTTNFEPHITVRLGAAFVPERNKVFANLTVSENLAAVGTRVSRQRRAGLRDRVFEVFPVLGDRQRELAGRLSGGQQQMLAIGRSLMSEPKLLIVDEMTLGLHHSLHPILFDVIKRIADDGAAVIIVDESTGYLLDVADYCYFFRDGRVEAEGPPSDFQGHELAAAGFIEETREQSIDTNQPLE